jgi:predicted AAA+ superfamily ATPase
VPRLQVDTGALVEPGRAHLVVGPRQAGKSCLVWSVLRDRRRPLCLNMEELVLRTWCVSPAAFVSDMSELGPIDALFLEEAQRHPEAALFLKGVADLRPSFPVIVTGSASFHLHGRTRESLAGRATRSLLLPFSLQEVSQGAASASPAALQLRRRDAIKRMLRLGGYPEVWLSPTPERILGDLLQAFVVRDASDLFAVERLDAYQAVMRLAAGQIGSLVNLSEYATIASVSVNTVARYLALMQEAHVLRLVPPFAKGGRREVTGAPKAFFLDNGLRNAVLGRLSHSIEAAADLGALVENWVFAELCKVLPWTCTLRHWRSLSGAELDFVLETPSGGSDGLLGIEVKAGVMRRPRLSRSSRSFIEAYAPCELWVLNDSLRAQQELGATLVRWLPLHSVPEEATAWWSRANERPRR